MGLLKYSSLVFVGVWIGSILLRKQKKKLTKEDIIAHFELIPHPEGGYFREVFRGNAIPMESKGATDKTGRVVPTKRNAFDGDDGLRNELTSIYWLALKTDVFKLCRNESDHVHYYLGGAPFEYLVMDPSSGNIQRFVLGPDIKSGQVLQVPVLGGHFKCGRVLNGCEDYTLIGEAVAPGFDHHDFRWIKREELKDLTILQRLSPYLHDPIEMLGFNGNGFHEGIYD